MAEIDVTNLTNQTVPEKWICPHCNQQNTIGIEAENIFLENFVYMENCEHCGYVHVWKLTLTDKFKKDVVNWLLNGDI